MESEYKPPKPFASTTATISKVFHPSVTLVGSCVPESSWGMLQSTHAAHVVRLTNQHRASVGLHPLVVAPVLVSTAEWKSMNMAGYLYVDHDDPAPVARTVADRFAACGYPMDAAWGENIAYGYPDPAAVVAAWLSDARHRENVENPAWTTIGVGVAVAENEATFWTQDFGTTGLAPTPPPPPSPPTIEEWKRTALPELKGWPAYQAWRSRKASVPDVKLVDKLLRDPKTAGTATTAFGIFLVETIRLLAR